MQVTITHEFTIKHKWGISDNGKVYRLPFELRDRFYKARRKHLSFHQGRNKYTFYNKYYTVEQLKKLAKPVEPYAMTIEGKERSMDYKIKVDAKPSNLFVDGENIDSGNIFVGKVYIFGKIAGMKISTLKRRFFSAKEKIKNTKAIPINHLEQIVTKHYDVLVDYTISDISKLLTCDGLYMLAGWEDDRNSRIVHAIAKELNFNIYYENE